jgi:putative ABC transport system permease protein
MGSDVPIARRNLLADKVKPLLALGGVMLAITLMVVVRSIYEGVRQDYESFVTRLPGDLWVAQKGSPGLTYSNSFLTDRQAADVATVPGVEAVHRLYGRVTSFEAHGDEVRVYVWALAPGGTLTPEEESVLPEPGTIFLDRAYVNKAHLSVGDVLNYDGNEFTVAKIGRIGNVLLAQFGFINYQDYLRLFGSGSAANFFLVSLGPDATDGVMEEIGGRVENTSVYTDEEFARIAEQPARDFLPIIQVITVISFIVGIAVLGSTVYSATIERVREYGLMKVLGASPLRLYRIVLSQSATIAILGFGGGVGLAFLGNRVAGDLVPQFVTYIRWQDVVFALGVTALMTFVASFLPINRVARVDPASVFRA